MKICPFPDPPLKNALGPLIFACGPLRLRIAWYSHSLQWYFINCLVVLSETYLCTSLVVTFHAWIIVFIMFWCTEVHTHNQPFQHSNLGFPNTRRKLFSSCLEHSKCPLKSVATSGRQEESGDDQDTVRNGSILQSIEGIQKGCHHDCTTGNFLKTRLFLIYMKYSI